jgi:NAD(P)H-hydrate epimerase
VTVEFFTTESGTFVPAVTTEQMREVDRVAVEDAGPNLYQMMENAGRNLALAAIEMLGASWRSAPVVALAGTGGNGGGGICAARHLANRGADVTVAVTAAEHLAPVTADQLDVYRGTPGRVESIRRLAGLEAALVIDAVIGYSLEGAPHGPAGEAIDWAGLQPAPILSLDVPSGVDATTGLAAGAFIRAATTLTLALPKTGLDAPAAGRVVLADIGIPAEVYRLAGIDVPPGLFGARYRVPLRPV